MGVTAEGGGLKERPNGRNISSIITHGAKSQENLMKQTVNGQKWSLACLPKRQLMSVLKTQEGEITMNQKRGRHAGPAACPWFQLCLVVLPQQGSQGESKWKLQEGHLWRYVYKGKEVHYWKEVQLTPSPCWREDGDSHFYPIFLMTVCCTSVVWSGDQVAFWKPDCPFTAFSFFPSLTLASYSSVLCYWLCKRGLWLHYCQLGKSAGWLLLLSQESRKAGLEGKKDFGGKEEEWQGEKIKKPVCGRWERTKKAQPCKENILSSSQWIFAKSIMERKSLSSVINTFPSPGYTQTHKWLRFHSCGLLLYHCNLELYL